MCEKEIYGEDINLGLLSFSNSFEPKQWLILLSEKGQVTLNSLNLDYNAIATLKQSIAHDWALSLEIKMTRKIVQSYVQIIAPPGLLVIVSWVTKNANFINEFYNLASAYHRQTWVN